MTNSVRHVTAIKSDDEGHTARNPSKKPVDLVHLSKQTFGSKDLETEVLGLFLSHSLQCMQRMRAAETDKDWAEAVHSIKGSARAIGAWKIGECAEIYERRAVEGDLNDKLAAFQDIEHLVQETNDYISALLKAA